MTKCEIDSAGWIQWYGEAEVGECPIRKDAQLVISDTNGVKFYSMAGDLDWSECFKYRVSGFAGDVETKVKPVVKASDRQEGGDHYKTMGVQVWDVVDTWPFDEKFGYYRGNVLKYTMRCGKKDARVQELKKAKHYLEKLIEMLEVAHNGK